MSNPYGWGQNEPQIKPKDQGGDTIATFSQKIYNLFDNLFNTLNSYPWSTATQSDAGYMSAEDKAALDDVPTTYLKLSGGAMSGDISNAGTGFRRLLGGSSVSTGARVAVAHESDPSYPGQFWLVAKATGIGEKMLAGAPDGTLTWDSKDVATIQTGTWTPVLKGGTTAGTFTASATGEYIKLGDLVYIYGRVEITACTSVPSGNIMISGLPYVAYGGTGGHNMTILCRANGFDNNSAQKIYGLFVVGNTSNLIARVPSLSPTIGISMFSEGVWSTTNTDTVAVKVTQGSYTGTAFIFAGWYLSK